MFNDLYVCSTFQLFCGKSLMKGLCKLMEELKLKTSDNITIAVNHYSKGFDKVVIIAPGWFMTKDSKFFQQMSEIFSESIDVLALDFRGHGKSGGFYTFTTKEELDISAVIDYAKDNYKEIYLMGFSLGAAISLVIAAKKEVIKKAIVVSPPTCFNKIENNVWKKEAWLPTFQKCELRRWLSIRPGFLLGKKTNPVDVVNAVKCPTLFIAGEKDPTVFPWHTEKLYEKAVCKKKYELFENCYHSEDLFIQNKDKFVQVCKNWLFEN